MNRIQLCLVLGAIMFGGSCQKSLEDITETSTSAEDLVAAESAMASAFEVVDDIASSDSRVQKNSSTLLPAGALVFFTDSLFTDGDGVDFVVDFGTPDPYAPASGLLCGDGKFRAGMIEINASMPYSQTGCVITANFPSYRSYHVGSAGGMQKVLGTLIATRTGPGTATIEVINGSVSNPHSGLIQFAGVKNLHCVAGYGNAGAYGDWYEITGSGTGINHKGEAFEMEITETLVKRVEPGCATTFVKGVIQLKNTGANGVLTVDFDPEKTGACDSRVELTLPGGVKRIFELK